MRYLAATDGVIGSYIRRMSEASSGMPRAELRDLPSTRAVNEAIGELTIFASVPINRQVATMHGGLLKLSRLAAIAPMPDTPAGRKWETVKAAYYVTRAEIHRTRSP